MMTSFQVGSLVCLHGLSGKDSVKYNYHHAVVADIQDDRLLVKVCGTLLACKKSKILVLPPDSNIEAPMPTLCGCVSFLMGLRLLTGSAATMTWGFPEGIAGIIMSFLQLPRIRPSEVHATGCSSTRGDFPIGAVLLPNDDWWISAQGSAPGGRGSQFLEFSFSCTPPSRSARTGASSSLHRDVPPHDTHRGGSRDTFAAPLSEMLSSFDPKPRLVVRRVSNVGVRIPPLPHGPLSVRDFHVLVLSKPNEDWRASSPTLRTLNSGEMQRFALVPPVDAIALRLVFTSNAIACQSEISDQCTAGESMSETMIDPALWCIGLFQIEIS